MPCFEKLAFSSGGILKNVQRILYTRRKSHSDILHNSILLISLASLKILVKEPIYHKVTRCTPENLRRGTL